MSDIKNRPDWSDIQQQFREYIAAYHAGDITPPCRDRLFSSIYQAVEYLSIVRYRHYAGYGTRQTDLALDGVQNRFWKIDREVAPKSVNASKHVMGLSDQPGKPDAFKEVVQRDDDAAKIGRRTFTSLVTEEYRDEAPLAHFLSTVVGNALRDWFREQNRHKKLDLQLSEDMFKEIIEIGISDVPATSLHLAWGVGNRPSNMDDDIEIHEIKKSITRLCARDQQMLELYYFQEMSAADIAEMTGIKQSTVRTQISRATQALRNVLSAQ